MTIQFYGAPQFGNPDLFTRNIEVNIVEYLKWGFLQAGGYHNVSYTDISIPSTGSSFASLQFFHDPNFVDGQVWQGRRTNWVWESGLNQPTQPIVVAVYVGLTLQNPSTYAVDYNGGRIIFNTAIATTSVVRASYAFRNVQVYDTAVDWVRELDVNSMKMDDIRNATPAGSGGDLEIFASRRAQLPLVIIKPLFNYRGVPYEVGSSTMKVRQDFHLTCLSQTPWELFFLHDVLVACDRKFLPAYDINIAPKTFKSDGSLAVSRQTFEGLVANFPYKETWNVGTRSSTYWMSGALNCVDVIWTLETII